jgi:hypothetical protein
MGALQRTIAAEARAIEEGHRAFIHGDAIRVVSDTTPGLAWLVTIPPTRPGEPLRFTCRPETPDLALNAHRDLHGAPGALPCKHAGVAARRLERHGLAAFVAPWGWVAGDDAPQPVDTAADVDPFAGFPT